MAFNPFHSFRKHKKVFFAGLTIMVMIVFIGSAGSSMSGGDILSSFSRAFGGRGRVVDVATVDGKGVSREEIVPLEHQRQLANAYMVVATRLAGDVRFQQIQSARGPQANPRQVESDFENDPEAIQLTGYLGGGGQGLYFAGGLQPRDILDFMIWQKEADRLGIQLSDADVKAEVNRLTLRKLDMQKFKEVDLRLRQVRDLPQGWTSEMLLNGLREEFRVRMAQEAMGYIPAIYQLDALSKQLRPLSPVAAATTPYEFREFYDDRTKKIEVGLIPVRVEDFVAKVAEQPTDKELKELFMKYRAVEYNPEADTPGFKQPKRVQVEWIGASADAPIYKKLAQQKLEALRAGSAAAAALGNAASGTGACLVGSDSAAGLAFDLEVLANYEGRKGIRFLTAAMTKDWRFFPPYPVHDSSMKQPTAIAGAVGNAFGLLDSGVLPFAALGSYQAGVTEREMADRAKFGATWIANGMLPTPFATAALAVLGTPREEYLPFDAVKGWIKEQLETDKFERSPRNPRLARNHVLESIMRELAAIHRAKDQKMLDAYLADKIKEYGLETGRSAEIASDYSNRFSLADDPGLKPLKEALLEAPSLDATGRLFDNMMTRGSGTYQPRQIPMNWESADRSFAYWTVAEKKDAMVPMDGSKTGKQVRAAVEHAWRFNKARALAKKEAERLLEEARKEKGDVKALRDFSKRTAKKDLIEIGPLGRFNRQRQLELTDKEVRYTPPRIPDSKVPYTEIPRDPRNPFEEPRMSPFAEKVIDLRKKAKGDGAVIADRPEGIYYAAVVTNVLPPTDSEFFEAYKDAASQAVRRDPLFGAFEAEQRKQFQKNFMERLRSHYKLSIDEEKFKEVEKRGSGSSDE